MFISPIRQIIFIVLEPVYKVEKKTSYHLASSNQEKSINIPCWVLAHCVCSCVCVKYGPDSERAYSLSAEHRHSCQLNENLGESLIEVRSQGT